MWRRVGGLGGLRPGGGGLLLVEGESGLGVSMRVCVGAREAGFKLTSAARSPPQMYPWARKLRITYALRHSGVVLRRLVPSTGNLCTSDLMALSVIRVGKSLMSDSHGL